MGRVLDWRQVLHGRVSYLVVGLLISVAVVWLILSRIPLGQIVDRVRTVNVGWLAAMVVGKTVILLGKHRRWRRVLIAMRQRLYSATYRAVAAGYFVNFLVPLKAGELVRSSILSRHNPDVNVGAGLTTVASERVLDATILALCAIIALPWVEGPSWLQGSVGIFSLFVLGFVLLVVTVPVHRRWIGLFEVNSQGLVGRIPRALQSLLAIVIRGTRVWRRPVDLVSAAFWTAGIWLSEAAVVWMATQALDLPMGYPAALVVTLLLTFGVLIPAGPAQVGTHQALMVLFLTPFVVTDTSTAVAVSLVLQGVNLAVLGAFGCPALIYEWLSSPPSRPAPMEVRRSQ